MQMAGPHPRLLMQQLWVGAQEFVPLTGPQVTMLQVQRRSLGTLRGCPLCLPGEGQLSLHCTEELKFGKRLPPALLKAGVCCVLT